MTQFIDRRLNPKGKSLANRQRFLRRARAQIREAVQKSLKDSAVADIGKNRKIKISSKGTREPRFRLDPKAGGERDFVLPGNKEYIAGDTIQRPPNGSVSSLIRVMRSRGGSSTSIATGTSLAAASSTTACQTSAGGRANVARRAATWSRGSSAPTTAARRARATTPANT